MYAFDHWVIGIDGNGCVYVYPALTHPMRSMYDLYKGTPTLVAVWKHLGAWGDFDVSRTPKHVVAKILEFTNQITGE